MDSMDASGLRPMTDAGQASESLAIVSSPRGYGFASGVALEDL